MKEGWEIKKLGDICRFINGRAYSKEELLNEGKYKVLRVGNFFTNNNWYYSDLELDEDKYCENGDLLYAWSASFGPRIWTGNKMIYHYHIWKVIPIQDMVTKEFLFQLLEWDTEAIKSAHGTGTTMMHVGKGSIESRLVPIPPVPEQESIVAILVEAFDSIAKAKANAEQNLKNAKELFESYLQSVFENKGEGWEEKTLDEICDLISKGSSPKWQGIKYVDEAGILFITSENVGENTLILSERKYVEEKFNIKDKKSILKNGDVLTNIVGASIGRTAIYNLDDVANINQAVCLIRCKQHLLHNEFLMYLLNSPFTRQHLHDNEVNNARANLSLGFFRSLSIPLPVLSEQKVLVNKIKSFHFETKKLESFYQSKIENLEELKKSLLQKAFNGEL